MEQRIANMVEYDIPFVNIGAQAARDPGLCKNLADAIVAAGGKAEVVELPDVGIFGNSHMMMAEKNSDEIAQFIVDWIDDNVK